MTEPLLIVDLAVVPVFVNTGAALLPALIAGLTGFVTILFKPRQLIRVCREKPLRPLMCQYHQRQHQEENQLRPHS